MNTEFIVDDATSLETFESIKNIAAAHARGDASTSEIKKLHQLDPKLWRSALACTKRELEVQMTAVRSRLNKVDADYVNGNITSEDRNDSINKEMQWKSKATRFLASVETDLLYVNHVIHANTRRVTSTTSGTDGEQFDTAVQ